MNPFKLLFNKKRKVEVNLEEVINSNFSESEPINFGEKTVWTCLKTNEITSVLKMFKIGQLKKTNWSEAFKRENDDSVFIIGPVSEWVLIIGWAQIVPDYNNGMHNVHEFINNLSETFTEAHYYLCQRTTDSVVWVKSINGKIKRSYCNGDGIFHQTGSLTEIELKLKIVNKSFEILTEEEMESYNLPGIKEVSEVASNWSINPCQINEIKSVPRNGYLLKPTKGILEILNITH